jgi:8-oxo-dGTP pyrophosphatase MutT (NUDIX family)
MKHKVLAYITRTHDARLQLLVFDHRDYPDAGTQVPAGTVEDGEPVEAALWREVWEETGLKTAQLKLIRKLAEHVSQEWQTVRHVYHLATLDALPDTWTQLVRGVGEDNGLVFVYRWETLPLRFELAGKQGSWLGALTQP